MTQWRVGYGGAYGLDYSAIPTVFRMHQIPRDRHPELFEAIQVMELAALQEMQPKK